MSLLQMVSQFSERELIRLTIAVSPILFFFFDILVRRGFGLRLEDAGADLSLGALTFVTSILFDNFNRIGLVSPDISYRFSLKGNLFLSFLVFLWTLILWVSCLSLVAPRGKYARPEQTARFNLISSYFLGVFSFVFAIWLFVEV